MLPGDEFMAKTLVDHLPQRCDVLDIDGRSYQLRDLERFLQEKESSLPKTGG